MRNYKGYLEFEVYELILFHRMKTYYSILRQFRIKMGFKGLVQTLLGVKSISFS